MACYNTRECMLVPSMADYGVVQYIHLARNTQQVSYVICKVKLAKCKIFRNFCVLVFSTMFCIQQETCLLGLAVQEGVGHFSLTALPYSALYGVRWGK